MSGIAIIAGTASAVLAIITAVIYTYACLKSRPCTLPIASLCLLLWAFAAELTYMLHIIANKSDNERPVVLFGLAACYAIFLVGTFWKSPKK